jgi:DNA-binding LytR/AlgR family response regulator
MARKKALLVEDNPHHFDAFENILHQLDFDVLRLPNGLPVTSYDEAIEVFHDHAPVDLVLLDLELNGVKNGVDIAQYLLRNNNYCHIVFTTAHTTTGSLNELSKIGGDVELITKPGGKVNIKDSLFQIALSIKPTNIELKNRIELVTLNLRVFNIAMAKAIKSQRMDIGSQLTTIRQVPGFKNFTKDEILLATVGNFDGMTIPKNNTLILIKNSEKGYISTLTLQELISDKLSTDTFFQVSRNTIVNIQAIRGRVGFYTNKFVIEVGNLEVLVSENYVPAFIKRMQQYGLWHTD